MWRHFSRLFPGTSRRKYAAQPRDVPMPFGKEVAARLIKDKEELFLPLTQICKVSSHVAQMQW